MNTILQKRIEEAAEAIVEDYNHYQFLNDGTKDVYTQSAVLFMLNEIAQFIISNQWISVEEALPEKNTMCFVRKETEVGVIYDTDYIDYEGKWFFNFNRTSIKSMVITHWMPIPSLKGGERCVK